MLNQKPRHLKWIGEAYLKNSIKNSRTGRERYYPGMSNQCGSFGKPTVLYSGQPGMKVSMELVEKEQTFISSYARDQACKNKKKGNWGY